MGNISEATKNILYILERHCNNYFNPRNDPTDTTRDYPPAFLELAGRIQRYCSQQMEADRFVASVSEGGRSVHFATDTAAWQQVFARELFIYRRVRLI